MTKTPYEILGILPSATQETIKAAYRSQAKLYHPDKVAHLADEFKTIAEHRLKEINAAYAALKKGDVKKIKTYERPKSEPFTEPPKATTKKEPSSKEELSFVSCIGFNYGDTVDKVDKLLGRPYTIGRDYYGYYYGHYSPSDKYGLVVGFKKDKKISYFKIRIEAVPYLKERGIADPLLDNLGLKVEAIKAKYGSSKACVPETTNGVDNISNYERTLEAHYERTAAGLTTSILFQPVWVGRNHSEDCRVVEVRWR